MGSRQGAWMPFEKNSVVAIDGPGAVNGGQDSRKQDHCDEGEADQDSHHLRSSVLADLSVLLQDTTMNRSAFCEGSAA